MAIALPAAVVTAEQIFALVSAAGGAYEAIRKVVDDVKALHLSGSDKLTPAHRAAVHAAIAPLAAAAGYVPAGDTVTAAGVPVMPSGLPDVSVGPWD